MKKFKVNRLQQLIMVVLIYLGISLYVNAQQDTINSEEQEFNQDELSEQNFIDGEFTEEDVIYPSSETVETNDADLFNEANSKRASNRIAVFQRCVKAIIGSDSPVDNKRQEIDSQCQVQRQQIVESLPKDLREFMLLNMDRRIDMVIRNMKEAQTVIEETAEDIDDAMDELSTDSDTTVD